MTRVRFWLVVVAAMAMGVCLSFGASFFHDFSAVDDYALIVQNLAVRKPSFASIAWFFTHFDPELYIPLTYVSFFIDHTLFGLSSSMFHLHNLVLHGLNALLVALLLQKLFESRWIAAAGALLFALHPLQTEAVVWIAARKDLLATFWALASILFFLRNTERGGWKTFVASLLCFILALLAKVSVAMLPLVLVMFASREISLRSALRRTAPFFIIAAIFIVIAAVGKSEILATLHPLQRIVLTLYAMASVIGRMIVPVGLSVYHQPPEISAGAVAFTLIVPALIVVAWLARRRAPLVTFGIAWTLAFLILPSMNAQTDVHAAGATFAADRYGYISLVGFIIAVTSIVVGAGARVRARFVMSVAVFCILIAGSIFASRNQTAVWASPESLFRHAIEVDPSSTNARIVLVRTLSAQRKTDEAFETLKEGLRYADTADLHLEAGLIYLSLVGAEGNASRLAEAREQFLLALEKDPSMPEAYFMLGELETSAKDYASAIAFYDQAIEREPLYAEAMARKATLLYRADRLDDAEALLRKALAAEPSNRDALVALVKILIDRDQFDEAASLVEDALLLYPDDMEVHTLDALVSGLR